MNNIMTGKEFSDLYAEKNEMTKKDAKIICDSVFGLLKQVLEDGNGVNLNGFMKFYNNFVEECTRRNPMNGEAIICKAHMEPKAKFSKSFKDSFKNN